MTDPTAGASQNSSDYFEEESSQFLEALQAAVLPGDIVSKPEDNASEDPNKDEDSDESEDLEPPPCTQPSLKRRLFETEDDRNDVYGAAHFGEFGEYMRRKRAKLQIQNEGLKEPDGQSEIFKGLSIYINGYTTPSVQDLRQLIVKHGGVFQPYLDKKALVTHIIICSLTPAKLREFKHMKVVRPEWLVESAEAGVLLPWSNYLYVQSERPEASQGAKNNQTTLLNGMKVPSKSSTTTTFKVPQTPQPKTPTKPQPVADKSPSKEPEAAELPRYASSTSNPLATRVMANPDWRKAHTSVAPDFIEGYYKNSRLHHLSTWKAELKGLVQEAMERAEAGAGGTGHVGKIDSEETNVSMRGAELVMRSPAAKRKGKGKAVGDQERVIMHCDFDCFFVSAGLVSRPEHKGKPVVVCHSQGTQGGASSTSEIASSSYEARKFGIKNGMSLQQARKLCPGIITIPYEFERYKQFSLLFYTVLMSHADDLQAVSVDEALIDVTSTVTQLRSHVGLEGSPHDPAKDFAETIRAQIRKATSCEISIGISHNILLARLATRRAKPGGSFHLVPLDVPDFLAPLDIADLHGFGRSTKQKAQEKLGVTTLGELAKKSKGVLIDALGKATGGALYDAVRGIDDKKLESDKPRKSVSCEINYGIRFENNEQAEAFVHQMAAEVKKRLDAIDMVSRSITMKVMKRDPTAPVEPPKFLGHGSCDLFNKQIPLIGPGGRATSNEQIIGEHAWRLLKSFNFDPKELRGLGIQVQKLESASSTAHAPPGQAMLSFKRKGPAEPAGSSTTEPEIRVQPPSQGNNDITKTTVETSKPTVTFDLPSFSQVDMSVFDALPQDVRKELENEYKRRSASPFPGAAGPAPKPAAASTSHQPPPFLPHNKRPGAPNIFPGNPRGGGPNFKRISKQLAPRSAPAVSPGKSYLMRLLEQEKERKMRRNPKRHIPDAKLRDLNLDPEVFNFLPRRIQDEQLIRARILKEKGSLPSPPAERKILKPRKPEWPEGWVPYRAPNPKSRWVQPPFLKQYTQGQEGKKEKLFFSETDDVQRVLETWVTTYRHWAPREKDVEYLAKYLLATIDGYAASDVGVERGIAVMKWWLVLLRRFWPGSELYEEDEPDGSQTDWVGEAWWATFRKIKERMDVVARQKFGGCLSLR